jgi:peptidoglycan hydrolase CwlO-like protein
MGVMERPLKPRVLGDVVPRGHASEPWNAFASTTTRINLSYNKKTFRIPVTKSLKALIFFAGAAFLVLGSVAAPTIFTRASGDATTTDTTAERNQLQDQLQQLEGQINQYEGQIASYQSQGKTLNGEISQLNAKIAKLNLQIQATTLTISQLNQQITNTQSQIVVTQADIAGKKTAIGGLVQSLYQNDQASLLEIFLKNPHLSDFWSDAQNVALVQDNLRVAVQQTIDLQGQLQDQEQQFQASKADAASAAAYQRSQAAEVAGTKDQKTQLLTATKGQESKYQTLLQQTQATAAQIRNRIFQLLGGGQLTFEDAYQYAKLSSSATGIDPAFILAILDRESALGQNVGRCSYKTSMSPSNIPTFLQITQSLNLNPDTMLVSCANADGAYGGAMGPAQFVPSTWMLYADAVSGITGDHPASPWNNADAFAATALYLKDAMTGCKSVYSSVVSQERCTAAKYYAGSRWKNYLWTYGEAVVERAQSFAGDIKTITS